MTTIDERVSRLEGAFQQFDLRLEQIEARMERLEARIDGLYRMMMAMAFILATGALAVAGAIVTLAFRI